jgi:hypothetical protein
MLISTETGDSELPAPLHHGEQPQDPPWLFSALQLATREEKFYKVRPGNGTY